MDKNLKIHFFMTTLRVNDGTSTYCFASRNIKKGDEITDSYSQARTYILTLPPPPIYSRLLEGNCWRL